MFEHEGSQVWDIMSVSEKNKKNSWKWKDLGLDGGFLFETSHWPKAWAIDGYRKVWKNASPYENGL